MPSTPRPLSSEFARRAWSNLAAQSAEQLGLAAPIVAVVALGAGAGATGVLQTAQTLPFLLLSIPAGVLADRLSRRRLMVAAEALRALSLVGILTLVALSGLSVPLLGLLGFIGACGTVAYSVAAPALVPALVPSTALVAANGRLELARTVAFVAGPALAGVLVGWTGAAPAFALAAGLSIVAVTLLVRIVEPARAPRVCRHAVRELREGAAFVVHHRLLRPVLLTQVVFNTAFFVVQAVYVPYAVHRLALGSVEVGATLATYGGGMVLGALLAPAIMRRLRFGLVDVIGPVAGLVASVVMLLTMWMPSMHLAAASFFLLGAGPVIWIIATATLRQTVTPPDLLGRATAINSLGYGARPVGAALGALLGALYGAETALAVAALGFLAQACIILVSDVPSLARQPTAHVAVGHPPCRIRTVALST